MVEGTLGGEITTFCLDQIYQIELEIFHYQFPGMWKTNMRNNVLQAQ